MFNGASKSPSDAQEENRVCEPEMKRQHPDNPDLFWCPKCKGYKARGEFFVDPRVTHRVGGHCKACCYHNEHRKEYQRAYTKGHYERNKEEYKLRSKDNQIKHKDRFRVLQGVREQTTREQLGDLYIKRTLNQQGTLITPKTIELKRQQITLYRNIKQLGGIRDGLINKECNGNQQGI